MYLDNKHQFNAFKREMKGWYKKKQKKEVSILTYIIIMLLVFLTLVMVGWYLNI